MPIAALLLTAVINFGVDESGIVPLRPNFDPFGFTVDIPDSGTHVVDTNTIAVTLNGATLTPDSISKTGPTNTVRYHLAEPLPSDTTNFFVVTLKDSLGWDYKVSMRVAPVYSTISTAGALPDSAVAKDKRGFKIRVYQTDGGTQDATIAYNEDLLAGLKGPNVANLNDAGGVDNKGYFTWPGVINFDTTPSSSNGFFNAPDNPDSPFPGIPGIVSVGIDIENFVEEIVAALEFKTRGIYTMGVTTDSSDFLNGTDGYLVRSGLDPLNASSSTIIGFYDANAPNEDSRGVANSPFQVYVPQPGIYPFRLMYYQSAGTANLEWFVINPDGTRTLINDPSKADTIPAYYEWTTPPAPTIAIARSPNGVTITFTGILEQTTDLPAAQWQTFSGSTEVTMPADGPHKFFRAKQ